MGGDKSIAASPSWYEVEQATKNLLTGITTSAVSQTWGCGHVVHSVNGDALYASCPFCHYERLSRGS